MKLETKNLIYTLLDQIKNGDELREVKEQLKKRGIEYLLKSELSAHLGYKEGDHPSGDNLRMAILSRRSRMRMDSIG